MMQLPSDMRDTLVEQLDEYLDAHASSPDAEAVASYVVELIGTVAEELKLDDADEIILKLESSGELEAGLSEVLEEEFESNDEFEFTGEEVVSLLEKLCDLEWAAGDDDDVDDDDDDTDDFFEEFGSDEEED